VSAAVDTVVFDLGGVFIDWDPRHLYRQLLDDEAEMERFLETVCTTEWDAQLDAGRPFADGVAELVARHPDQEWLIRAYADRWEDMLAGEIPGTVEVLDELDGTGVRLFALTNWSSETFPIARRRFPFLERFVAVVVSGDEGIVKPDPRLFRVLVERHAVEPARSLFVDDARQNTEAAAMLGFSAERFTDAGNLRQRLVRERLLPRRSRSEHSPRLPGEPSG
jgi:2-haloacid dehalogenase